MVTLIRYNKTYIGNYLFFSSFILFQILNILYILPEEWPRKFDRQHFSQKSDNYQWQFSGNLQNS